MTGIHYLHRAGHAIVLALIALPAFVLWTENQRALPPAELTTVLGASALGITLLHGLHLLLRRTALLLSALIAMGALIETWFIHNYGWVIDANALSLVAETNPAEAGDLAGSIQPVYYALLALPWLLVAIAWPRRSQVPPRPTSMPRTLILASILGLTGIYLTACWLGTPSGQIVPDATFPADASGQALALRGAYPAGLPLLAWDYLRDRNALDDAIERNKAFRFGATAPDLPHRRVFVLIIGETTRADHLGINGYARNTTPALSRRAELVSFRRMYTVSTFTRLSVPVLISRKPPDRIDATFDEASIVSAFKEAGFRTLWISLQAPVGYHESPVSVHAYEADETLFLNPVDYRSHGKHDDAAIPVLRKVLSDPEGPDTFVVIHTLGSHFRYSDRYPDAFRRFRPDRRTDRPLRLFDPDDREMLVNAYDNTVVHLDRVLDDMISALAARPDVESWLLYSSDHGEALFDDCRMYSGHGQSALATHSVASIFWASPLYRRLHPGRASRMAAHADTLASTAMIFETLADLGGLEVPGAREQNSLASSPLRFPVEVAKFEAEQRDACVAERESDTH